MSNRIFGARELLSSKNPFVLGRYPDRPAPAHVLNGLVFAALGGSDRADAVRAFLGAQEPTTTGIPALESAKWTGDSASLATARSDLGLVLNPDRRLWEKIGSLVPLDARLATRDPSDDRLGALVWSLLCQQDAPAIRAQLVALLSEAPAVEDPLTTMARILCDGSTLDDPAATLPAKATWYGPKGTASGKFLRKSLFDFVSQIASNTRGPRPSSVQHLGRAVYLAAYLSVLLGPMAVEHRARKVASVDELATIVAFGDLPPGNQSDPMVAASARSFQEVVDHGRLSMAKSLKTSLDEVTLSSKVPARMQTITRVRTLLDENGVSAKQRDQIMKIMPAPPKTSADDVNDAWCNAVVDTLYPLEKVTAGLRSMGRKLGLAGPDRGAGVPRFVLETPLLGTLVAGLCPPGVPIPLDQFVDTCRARLGIIVGEGTDDSVVERLGFWESVGIGQRVLRENQDALKSRLIRAGLATEYSDGHTEVLNDVA